MPRLRVLLVDDDSVNSRLGARLVARLGCECVLLEDGDEVRDDVHR
jgi:CheY-like chemotaxis protein